MADSDLTESSGPPRLQPNIVELRNLNVHLKSSKDEFHLEVKELDIRRGSFTSILGSSGCGKTTLLHVLGLLRVLNQENNDGCDLFRLNLATPLHGDEDRVYTVWENWPQGVGGQEAKPPMEDKDREELRRSAIGFCLQGGDLFPALSILDNATIPTRLCGVEKPDDGALRILEDLFTSYDNKADVQEEKKGRYAGNLPGDLSGGQKQRGLVARAAVHRPDILFLDEPTSALDEVTAEETLKILRGLAKKHGMTVVMVTHVESLALNFSDAVICMKALGKGKGGLDDSRREELEKRLSETTASTGRSGSEPQERPPAPSLGARVSFYWWFAMRDAIGPPWAWLTDKWGRVPEYPNGEPVKRTVKFSFLGMLAKIGFVAVAIALLVLLLLGMRAGLVQKFKEDLLRSPTARELLVTPMAGAGGVTRRDLDALASEYPEIELVLPDATHVVTRSRQAQRGGSITLVGTASNDPKLAAIYKDQDFSGLGPGTAILPRPLAKKLGVAVGDPIRFFVTRVLDAEGEQTESSALTLRVCNVVDEGEDAKAYVDVVLIDEISDYKSGRPVKRFGWKGFDRPVEPVFSEFLVFSKRPVSPREKQRFAARGLGFAEIEDVNPKRTLFGLLMSPEEANVAIHAYSVRSGRQDGDLGRLDRRLLSLQDALVDSDGIMIPWNAPLPITIDGVESVAVGLSGSPRWLRKYLRYGRASVFPRDTHRWEVACGGRGQSTNPKVLTVRLSGSHVELPFALHVPPAATVETADNLTTVAEAAVELWRTAEGRQEAAGRELEQRRKQVATASRETIIRGFLCGRAAAAVLLSRAADRSGSVLTLATDIALLRQAVMVHGAAVRAAELARQSHRAATTAGHRAHQECVAAYRAVARAVTVLGIHKETIDSGELRTRCDELRAIVGADKPVDRPAAVVPAAVVPAAVVPAAVLAHLHMTVTGLVEPDPDSGVFRDTAEEVSYYKARVFVRDVLDVASMHQQMSQGYGVISQYAKVREVQGNTAILDRLVLIIGFVAMLIGVVTVGMVFWDMCDRKKGMIGILRVMGCTRQGIFIILMIRGLMMAVISSMLFVMVGFLTAELLNVWDPGTCDLRIVDYVLVVACLTPLCLVGTAIPSYLLSKREPVDLLRAASEQA